MPSGTGRNPHLVRYALPELFEGLIRTDLNMPPFSSLNL